MRLIKVGNKNWAVTDAVAKVAQAWDCKPVEGECFAFVYSTSFWMGTESMENICDLFF